MTVREVCDACFDAHQGDCSGFVKAVGAKRGVAIVGPADDIVVSLRSGGSWVALADGVAAEASAAAGKFVVAGLKGQEQAVPNAHGHVVVVADGELAHGNGPPAYWGSQGGTPGRDKTINWAWTAADRDRVSYAVWTAG